MGGLDAIVEFTFQYFKEGDKYLRSATDDCYFEKYLDDTVKEITPTQCSDDDIIFTEDNLMLAETRVVSGQEGHYGSVCEGQHRNGSPIEAFDHCIIFEIARDYMKARMEVKEPDIIFGQSEMKPMDPVFRVLTLWKMHEQTDYSTGETDCWIEFERQFSLNDIPTSLGISSNQPLPSYCAS